MAAFAGLGPVDPINAILTGGAATTAVTAGPLPSLAGFDAVLQFSAATLQAQVSSNLGQLDLGAVVPWGSIPIPASFLAVIPPSVLRTITPAWSILLTLTAPYVAAFHWPPALTVGAGGVGVAPGQEVAAAPGPKVGVPQPHSVDIGWELAINIVPPFRVGPPGPHGTGPVTAAAGGGAGSSSAGSVGPILSIPPATGTVITTAQAAPAVRSDIWVFSEQLDFSAMTPSATSTTQGVADLLATPGGQTLLNQAVVGLKTLSGVSLSPDVAPAGPVSPALAQATGLPALQVADILLQDAAGDSILCLCVQIAGSAGGVLQKVQPLLGTSDFAYAASETLLDWALNTRWKVAAEGVSVVSETQVELGNGQTGLAKVSTVFGALADFDIVAEVGGDVLLLTATQTVQLLELWDQNGNQVTNLGALATPEVEPFLLAVNYFGSSGAQSLQANFQTLLLQLMVVVGFPILDDLPIDPNSVTGFTSSPLRANLVRWALTAAGTTPALGLEAP
jgi:hypothetical protein